ncbi:ATP-binding protein [Domibacillus sp.]|uniref:ATP-binding protein n=1 Tax=Domibacillus sp. TaxID=1969783 RepID=UPI00281183E7|nr:ATP-binding protein [Domibacillus sp.]
MEDVKAFPAKSFFVNMLTRDINLSDAILDLIDNCVDGIVRTISGDAQGDKPYDGYFAKVTITKDMFSIEDNCGGIPLDIAKEYAFRMGRPDHEQQYFRTVGLYGIGMKRAIFKLGKNALVSSYSNTDKFQVKIDSDWLQNDNNWSLPLEHTEDIELETPGTLIKVTDLYENISEEFSVDTYINNLKKLISNHYSFIINKGFKVYVNDERVTPHNILFIYTNDPSGENIAPYIYQSEIEGVKVDLKVGIYRETPSDEDLDEEQVVKRTSEDSGWTIICNDRVVVYNDKTILTGWGEATVPNFHNQFIGITGVVHFQSSDVKKLPLTTTKRGIDASSKVYLYTKKYMREGTKTFTNYTNKVKKDLRKEKEFMEKSSKISFEELNKPEYVSAEKFKPIRNAEPIEVNAIRFKPTLPVPELSSTSRSIRFSKELSEIETVSNYLFEAPDRSPSEVGTECFDTIYREALKALRGE